MPEFSTNIRESGTVLTKTIWSPRAKIFNCLFIKRFANSCCKSHSTLSILFCLLPASRPSRVLSQVFQNQTCITLHTRSESQDLTSPVERPRAVDLGLSLKVPQILVSHLEKASHNCKTHCIPCRALQMLAAVSPKDTCPCDRPTFYLSIWSSLTSSPRTLSRCASESQVPNTGPI